MLKLTVRMYRRAGSMFMSKAETPAGQTGNEPELPGGKTASAGTPARRAEAWIETRISSRTVIFATCGLFLTQIAVVFHFGGRTVGGLLGNLIQLLLGLLCVLSAVQAFRRSGATGRDYWRWLATAFTIWVLAHTLVVLARGSHEHRRNLQEVSARIRLHSTSGARQMERNSSVSLLQINAHNPRQERA